MHLYWFSIGLLRRIQKYTRNADDGSAEIFQTPTRVCDLVLRARAFRRRDCVNKSARAKNNLHETHFFSRAIEFFLVRFARAPRLRTTARTRLCAWMS